MSSTARHARVEGARRHWRLALTGVVSVCMLVGGVVAFTRPSSAQRSCPSSPALTVAVAPDLAPVVASVARSITDSRPPACDSVQVLAQEPADVFAATRKGGRPTPDVWIPDSTLWLDRAGLTHDAAGPVATSPVTLAAVAAPGGQFTPNGSSADLSVVVPRDGRRPVTLRMADPVASTRTSAVLVGLRTVLGHRADARRVMAGLLDTAVVRRGADASAAPLTVRAGTAVPASEQQVFAANEGRPTPAVLALYASGPGSVLDYPYAVLTSSSSRERLADRLLTALRDTHGRDALYAAGFRDSSGRAGGSLPDTVGVDATRPGTAAPARPGDVAAVVAALRSVRQDARLLAVVDVSGSMGTPVPGAGGATRLQLVQSAARRGLSLYPDRSAVGLWAFSTRLHGDDDYRRVLPVTVLGPRGDHSGGRAAVAAAISGIRPTNGNTGLYDTTLAAVRSQWRSWQPNHTNAVVLLTDGRNQDPEGISLAELVRTLRAEQDPSRPVPVISIAYGSDPQAARALAVISEVTGGATYTARPQDIDQVFLDALGQRACRPLCTQAPVR
jgi:Ca-activated chloride channel homolog